MVHSLAALQIRAFSKPPNDLDRWRLMLTRYRPKYYFSFFVENALLLIAVLFARIFTYLRQTCQTLHTYNNINYKRMYRFRWKSINKLLLDICCSSAAAASCYFYVVMLLSEIFCALRAQYFRQIHFYCTAFTICFLSSKRKRGSLQFSLVFAANY